MRRLQSLALLLSVGCGTAPSVSAEKVQQFSETFAEYAIAVEAVKANVDAAAALPDPATDETLAPISADLSTIAEALRADASNVKTAAVVERIEKVGTAVASVPHPFAKIGGWALAAGALIFGLAARKKKPALPS